MFERQDGDGRLVGERRGLLLSDGIIEIAAVVVVAAEVAPRTGKAARAFNIFQFFSLGLRT